MRLIVIIASAGRREMLARTLQHLTHQHRVPDEVIISASAADDVPDLTSFVLKARVVVGPRGSVVQRNRAIDEIDGRADIITFLDDDFLPSSSYFARLEREFTSNPDYAVVHGNVVADGAHNAGYSFEEGLSLLRDADAKSFAKAHVTDHPGAYGCNMSVRAALVRDLRFDERLVLYGWQEDIDFTNQLGRHGRIVSISNLIGVHLGMKCGRVNGARLGYSQIANPVYLVRKGTMPLSFAANLVARNMIANAVKSFWPEPWIDRRGRCYGNMIALWHIVTGRIEPEYVLKLSGDRS